MSNRILFAFALLLALGCKDRSSETAGTESAIGLPEDTESSSAATRDYRSVAE